MLDDQVVSAPQVASDVQCNQGLGSNSIITIGSKGSEAQTEAKDLALVLRYGSLPVELGVATTETVSPTLGIDSLHAGLWASLVGLILVVIFVLVLYRAYGLIIVAQLVVFAACNYVFVCLMGEFRGMTLSLSGIAAFAMRSASTPTPRSSSSSAPRTSCAKAVRHAPLSTAASSAWKTILAGNMVSFIAAFVLYLLAIGSVRGFALNLGVAVLLDLLISWVFTRPLTLLLSDTGAFGHDRNLFWHRPSGAVSAEATA